MWLMKSCRIALLAGLMVTVAGTHALGAPAECPGTKKLYRGECLYPDEIKQKKAKRAKTSAKKKPQKDRPKASPSQAPVSAESLAKEAIELFEAGRYRDAADTLSKAYTIQAEPVFLLGIGSCYQHLGDGLNCVSYFRRYLTEYAAAHSGAMPDNADDVRQAIEQCRGASSKPGLDWTAHYGSRFSKSDARTYTRRRDAMVSNLEEEGTLDRDVITAMATVPMELFAPDDVLSYVYQNSPVPVGYDETISQPTLTASMLTMLGLKPGDKVLEVKTASGYQTALMAQLGATVYTVETNRGLGRKLQRLFAEISHGVIHLKVANRASPGWPEHGPYEAIIVTAALETLPSSLTDQLAVGGRLLAPIGPPEAQYLRVYNKHRSGEIRSKDLLQVRFGLMPGE